MLGADELDPEDLALVRYGLNCLAQMLPNKWEALSHSFYAIEHMITLLTKGELNFHPLLEVEMMWKLTRLYLRKSNEVGAFVPKDGSPQ
jgi:hypothetical protein